MVQSRSAASGIERFPLPPRRNGRLLGRGLQPDRRVVEDGAAARAGPARRWSGG